MSEGENSRFISFTSCTFNPLFIPFYHPIILSSYHSPPMKHLLYLLSILIFLSACNDPVIPLPPEVLPARGDLVQAVLVKSYTQAELQAAIDQEVPSVFAAQMAPENGIDYLKLIYLTHDAKGNIVQASGGVAVPKNLDQAAPLFSYQHGTISQKERVPSRGFEQSGEALVGMIMGGKGFLACLPDYLGLGDSEGPHPYVHSATEANAAVDLLRAARHLADSISLALNDQLFITGYSQGGHATMALHKALEEQHADEFTLTAAAPMAGPYSLSGVMAEIMLRDEPYVVPSYLPFMLLGYNAIYDLYSSPSDYFASPYDVTIPPLFDGTRSTGEIDQQLPAIPKQMLRPDVLNDYINNPDHPLRQALVENDLYDWTPKAQMRIFHCEGDMEVSPENSHITLAQFQANGFTDVSLIQPDVILGTRMGHYDCALPSLVAAQSWFVELKE